MEPASEYPIRAGRYTGELAREQDGGGEGVRLDVELRLESGGRIELSADLFQRPAPADSLEPYAASLRATGPPAEGPSWPVTWSLAEGKESPGTATITARADSLTVQLELEQGTKALPAATYGGAVNWVGPEFRELRIETRVEPGIEAAPVLDESRHPNVKACLATAGFAVTTIRPTSLVHNNGAEWHTADIFTELHTAMSRTATAPLDRPSWNLHLLLLGESTRDGLFGLMFDHMGDLQRQGAAVFVRSIRKRIDDPLEADRRILQTSVHELGHALNLMHRFSDGIRRIDSTSFMNYDWRYKGGCHADDYWRDFQFTFDPDELDFLHHWPEPAVIPGGRPFGTARYWPEPVDRAGVGSLQLWLTPPRAGSRFIQGQPVYLEVSLRNVGNEPAFVQRHMLDIKAGYLDILVEREVDDPSAADPASLFTPLVHRCFDASATPDVPLKRGESIHANLNLTFGSAGPPFAKPGKYHLRPVLTCSPFRDGSDVTVLGATLDIDITAAPESWTHGSERHDLDLILGRPVGTWFALGGAAALDDVGQELDELRARWLHGGIASPTHPVLAAINRSAGIYAWRQGDDRTALERLGEACVPAALATFDPHTAEHTWRLAHSVAAETPESPATNWAAPTAHADKSSAQVPAPPGSTASRSTATSREIIVALTSPSDGASRPTTRYVPGIALDPKVSQGAEDLMDSWVVLVPVTPDLGDVEDLDVVVLATHDEVSQTVGVSHIDLIRPADETADTALAVLTLARGISASAHVTVSRSVLERALHEDRDVWTAVHRVVAPEDAHHPSGVELEPWVEAATTALESAPPPVEGFTTQHTDVTRHAGAALEEIANIFCRIVRICDEQDPGGEDDPWTRARLGAAGLRRCW